MPKNFCVIGAKVSQTWPRNWYESEAAAVEHAKQLASDNYERNQKPTRLFVVERKQVVELGFPEAVVRTPSEQDEGGGSQEDD